MDTDDDSVAEQSDERVVRGDRIPLPSLYLTIYECEDVKAQDLKCELNIIGKSLLIETTSF
jgi:hypothetical protein